VIYNVIEEKYYLGSALMLGPQVADISSNSEPDVGVADEQILAQGLGARERVI